MFASVLSRFDQNALNTTLKQISNGGIFSFETSSKQVPSYEMSYKYKVNYCRTLRVMVYKCHQLYIHLD